MKERPILFSALMVRAILAGAKTQTRRVLKQQPPAGAEHHSLADVGHPWHDIYGHNGPAVHRVRCPYGQPGDRLWVKETFRLDLDRMHSSKLIVYRADDAVLNASQEGIFDYPDVGWKPSIHMPRWASRITLEITGVRAERLHDINEDDAISEGVERAVTGDGWRRYRDADMELAGVPPVATARQSYFTLWNQIHGHGAWVENPWVWVVEFKRVEGEAA